MPSEDSTHDCADHTVSGAEGTCYCAACEAEARAVEGLPRELARVLRDPTIVIDRDHEIRLADGRTLAEHMHDWRNAPSNTASAHIDERAHVCADHTVSGEEGTNYCAPCETEARAREEDGA